MSSKLTEGDKATLKYLGLRLSSWILVATEIVGALALIGTIGAIERDYIAVGKGVVQFICIAAAMSFIGFLIWIIESVSPYILKQVKQMLREERKAKRQKAMRREQTEYEVRRAQRMHV